MHCASHYHSSRAFLAGQFIERRLVTSFHHPPKDLTRQATKAHLHPWTALCPLHCRLSNGQPIRRCQPRRAQLTRSPEFRGSCLGGARPPHPICLPPRNEAQVPDHLRTIHNRVRLAARLRLRCLQQWAALSPTSLQHRPASRLACVSPARDWQRPGYNDWEYRASLGARRAHWSAGWQDWSTWRECAWFPDP